MTTGKSIRSKTPDADTRQQTKGTTTIDRVRTTESARRENAPRAPDERRLDAPSTGYARCIEATLNGVEED
jgi:hypothetical protein